MKPLTIKAAATVNAPLEKVFEALTDSKKVKSWSGQKANIQLSIGGKFEIFDGWIKGVVLAFIPNLLLVVTWKPAEWAEDVLPSIVTYNLSEGKAGTRITVTQTGFPNPKEAQSHKEGWPQFVFEPLNMYLLKQK